MTSPKSEGLIFITNKENIAEAQNSPKKRRDESSLQTAMDVSDIRVPKPTGAF